MVSTTVDNVPFLFGSRSQRSYVSDKLRKQLKLPTLRSERISINTFLNTESKLKEKITQIECYALL